MSLFPKTLSEKEQAVLTYLAKEGIPFGSRSLGVHTKKSDYDYFLPIETLKVLSIASLPFSPKSVKYTLLANFACYTLSFSDGTHADLLFADPTSNYYQAGLFAANFSKRLPNELLQSKEFRREVFAALFKLFRSKQQPSPKLYTLFSEYCPEALV